MSASTGKPATAASQPAPTGDARNRDKVMMLVATAARMALGLITFVLLARYLGPAHFGVIATAMAYATLVSLATDYGLATSTLRKAAITPEKVAALVGDALAVKGVLSAIALGLALPIAAFVVPDGQLLAFAMIFIGTVTYSFADLMMVAARATRRFDVEAKLVVSTSAVMVLGVGGVAWWTTDLTAVAAAFLVTRAVYLGAAFKCLGPWLEHGAAMRRSVPAMVTTLRSSSSYAVDNILTVVISQMDVVLLAVLLTAYEVGIYQAGSRLVQVIVPFTVVLSTVYMPALASASAGGLNKQFTQASRRLSLEFGVISVLVGGGFVIVGPYLTDYIYPIDYAPLKSLWLGFGLYAMWRFASAALGIQLVSLGRIAPRVIGQLVTIVLFIGAAALLVPRYGLGIGAWLLAGQGAVLFAIYCVALLRTGRPHLGMTLGLAGVLLTVTICAVLARVPVG